MYNTSTVLDLYRILYGLAALGLTGALGGTLACSTYVHILYDRLYYWCFYRASTRTAVQYAYSICTLSSSCALAAFIYSTAHCLYYLLLVIPVRVALTLYRRVIT